MMRFRVLHTSCPNADPTNLGAGYAEMIVVPGTMNVDSREYECLHCDCRVRLDIEIGPLMTGDADA